MNTIGQKTAAIKARVYNQIRTDLYKKKLQDFKPQEKIEYFDKVFSLNIEAHRELNAYKSKRKDKAEIHAARVARGYKFKTRTKKEDYLAMSK